MPWALKAFGVAFVETYSTVQGDLTAGYGASTQHVRLLKATRCKEVVAAGYRFMPAPWVAPRVA